MKGYIYKIILLYPPVRMCSRAPLRDSVLVSRCMYLCHCRFMYEFIHEKGKKRNRQNEKKRGTRIRHKDDDDSDDADDDDDDAIAHGRGGRRRRRRRRRRKRMKRLAGRRIGRNEHSKRKSGGSFSEDSIHQKPKPTREERLSMFYRLCTPTKAISYSIATSYFTWFLTQRSASFFIPWFSAFFIPLYNLNSQLFSIRIGTYDENI